MSITSVTNRNTYTGTSLLNAYDYTFKIFDDDDIEVLVRLISTGAETVLTKTTDYTVDDVGESAGGTVTLVNASQAWLTGGFLLSTYKIILRLKKVIEQATDIKNNSDYYAYLHEEQFDKLFQIDLTQQDEIDRSVKLPKAFFTSDFNPILPAALVGRASAYLMTNTSGDGWTGTGSVATDVPLVTGSRASAQAIVAATGISFTGLYWFNIWFIAGSGGAVVVSATNRIADGTSVGQRLVLCGTSDANYVDLADGNNLKTGGQTIRLGNNSVAEFFWDGSDWILMYTNGLVP